MDADDKTCPLCAETVKAAAVVCKHCGYNFQTGKTPSVGAPAAKKGHILRNGCLGVVAIIGCITVIGALGGRGNGVTSSTDTPAAVDPIKVTAWDLDRAFKANEVAAHQKYGDAPLLVSGRITDISLDFKNAPYIAFATDNEFMNVQAELADGSKGMAAGMKKGDAYSVLCTGKTDMIIGTVHLSDCEVQ